MSETIDKSDILKRLLLANAHLFWWVPAEKVETLPLESLVEAVLNGGTMDAVRALLENFGDQKIASIFRKQMQNERRTYSPQVANYFTLYFNKYAP